MLQEPTNKLLGTDWQGLVRTRSAWAVRERQHEVSARQQLLKLVLQPSLSLTALAHRAVPVPTRFQNVVEFLALLASINDDSRVWCSATHDRNHGLDLIRRHTVSELFQIGWPVDSEDFTDRWNA